MIGTDTISRVIGQDVYDESGEKIGSAAEVYLDDETGQPEWATVRTGLFGTKESFVPIRNADLTNDGLRVAVSKEQVKDAPKIDTDGHLSPQEEAELYRYYGMGTGMGAGTETATTGMADTTTGYTDTDGDPFRGDHRLLGQTVQEQRDQPGGTDEQLLLGPCILRAGGLREKHVQQRDLRRFEGARAADPDPGGPAAAADSARRSSAAAPAAAAAAAQGPVGEPAWQRRMMLRIG